MSSLLGAGIAVGVNVGVRVGVGVGVQVGVGVGVQVGVDISGTDQDSRNRAPPYLS